jgi:hypothetical protein
MNHTLIIPFFFGTKLSCCLHHSSIRWQGCQFRLETELDVIIPNYTIDIQSLIWSTGPIFEEQQTLEKKRIPFIRRIQVSN